MTEFTDKIVWVTGASGAIGSAIVAQLARAGAFVVASSRRSRPEQDGVVQIPADVTDDGAIRRAADKILDTFGRIDGLVTSSTVPIFGEFLTLADEDWHQVIDTKLMGSLRPLRAALPGMIERRHGSVVLISGRGGLRASPLHLPGSAVNAALILLAQGLATRYGPDGVRINAVSPGPIVSPRLEAMMSAGVPRPATALGNGGTPQDVADAVLFLLSDKARHITGTNLVVDGGGSRQS